MDHAAKLEKYSQFSTVGRNFTWFAYIAIVGLAWTSAVLFYVKQGYQHNGYMFSGAFALFLTLALPTLYRWYQEAFFASVLTPAAMQGVVGHKILELHDDFIQEIGERVSVRVLWRDIQRIDDDQHRIWFVIAPLIVIAIPNRAFHSAAERDLFLRECRTRIADPGNGVEIDRHATQT